MITRTELHIPRSPWSITHHSKILLLGSCFADNMGERLVYHGFDAKINPFGTTFNPISLAHIIDMIIGHASIDETKYVCTQGVWHHYHFHSRMASLDKKSLHDALERLLEEVRQFIAHADYLFITLGTSIAYKVIEGDDWVNNCHKQSSQSFSKNIISVSLGSQFLFESIERLLAINPNLRIGFTLSPVRHTKDGLQENAKSKARCLLMIDECVHKIEPNGAYFPAYEWMIDDLRDYRFYADDLIHPSDKALDFIWQRFGAHYMYAETLLTCQEINQIRMSLLHRPFNSDSEAHKAFLDKLRHRQKQVEGRFPHLRW